MLEKEQNKGHAELDAEIPLFALIFESKDSFLMYVLTKCSYVFKGNS